MSLVDVMHSERTRASTWVPSFLLALAGATIGVGIWFIGATFLGRISVLAPYVGALALPVGGLAGFGALYGAKRLRGFQTQLIAVSAALPMLAVGEALYVRLVFVWELEKLELYGAALNLPLATYWEYVTWGLFSTNPPALLFWAVALGYAIAVTRRYGEEV